MTLKPRRSYEPGHRPKFLVVVDDTAECDRAIYFAARRASRVGADVMMLSIIDTTDFQQWLGVESVMRAEAEEEANKHLDLAAATVRRVAGIEPLRAIREGDKSEQILDLIEEDEDISLLVLAAGTDNEGPGPLVSTLSTTAGTFPIPIAIVPGKLSDAVIDTLA
jgi:nucleotide-binding universal stress UspA family protein